MPRKEKLRPPSGSPARTAGSVAGVISLGCSKNTVDTEFLMGELAAAGWDFSPIMEDADLLIVNTCSFLDSSVTESDAAVEEALEWKGEKAGRRVAVAGCMVSRFGRALESRYPEVDLFLMPGGIPRLAGNLSRGEDDRGRFTRGPPSFLPPAGASRLVTTGSWAYLKISDGCDNRCSYCLIPSIRGRHRSRSRRSILDEAGGLIEGGVRELNLIGQDITRWGREKSGQGLRSLVEDLCALDGVYRLRLLYLHPSRVDRGIVRLLAEHPRVFPYLDIPIQHGSDRILEAMGRPYRRRRLERMYTALRRSVPAIALRTTVMVGFPGETKREFRELVRFLREFPFENLGAFVFSPQPGTAAAELPGAVPPGEGEERYHEIMTLQQEQSARLWRSRRGSVTEALVVQPVEGEEDLWLGRTAWQAPEVDGHAVIRGRAYPGALVKARITGSDSYDLEGGIISSSEKSPVESVREEAG